MLRRRCEFTFAERSLIQHLPSSHTDGCSASAGALTLFSFGAWPCSRPSSLDETAPHAAIGTSPSWSSRTYRDFGTVKGLDGIEIQLGEGQFRAGCWKTTARLVAGFDRRDAGPDRRRLAKHITSNKRDMGMSRYSLFPNMTARQNVEYGLKIRGREKADRRSRVSELLELVGLGHAGDGYPHQLSGGMQQRARARARAGDRAGAVLSSTSRSRRSMRRRACSCARRWRIQLELRDHDAVRHPRPGRGAVGRTQWPSCTAAGS